jgi:DNA-binding NtrC family response regulator
VKPRKYLFGGLMSAKIMIIEDDEDLRELYQIELQDLHNVITFSSPVDAINYYKEDSEFDLVITDQDMPEIKGEELVHKFKDINESQKIALITGYGFMVKFPPHFKVRVYPKPANIKSIVSLSLIGIKK